MKPNAVTLGLLIIKFFCNIYIQSQEKDNS